MPEYKIIIMAFLLFSIFSSTLIFITFKLSERFSCRLFNIIVINYLTATIVGFGLMSDTNFGLADLTTPWALYAIITGLMFIGMFFLIGLSSRKIGIAVTTVASKTSMVIPVFFSILYFSETVTLIKILGLISAVIAVFFSLYKKGIKTYKSFIIVLPVIIFFGSGIIDSVVKFAQEVKIPNNKIPEFTSLVFLTALVSGLAISFFKKDISKYYLNLPTLGFGILLGLSNYGSLFFIIKALSFTNLDSSLIFAINNMSIVIFTALAGYFLFKENLTRLNIAGIALAFISIYLLSAFSNG